jgi:hypothetical protein
LSNLWRTSLTFRRVVAALSLAIAALIFYLASNIPLTASLPNEEVDKRATAHGNEELRIYKPRIDVGDPVLSFEGAANVAAEVWIGHATLTGSAARLLAPLAPQGPVRVVYAASQQDIKATGKDCRTSLTITRPDNSEPPQTLRLWQSGATGEDQRYRQILVSSKETPFQIQVSTDAPQAGVSCPRTLTMGATAIPIPAGPIQLLAPAGEPVKLLFTAIDSSAALFSEKKDTFDGLSLGDGDLTAHGLDIVSTTTQKEPLLHVLAHQDKDAITLHDLKLGAEQVRLSVGEDLEQADTWANGTKFPVVDLVDKMQKNPVLSFFLAAVLIPGLWKWIQKSCFPKSKEAGSKESANSEPATTD